MARYKINRRSWIGGEIREVGDEVEYDGVPGSALDPLDDAAKTAIAAISKTRRRGLRLIGESSTLAPIEHDPRFERGLVEIPEDWMELLPSQKIKLAQQLGSSGRVTGPGAERVIELELIRRKTV